VAYIITIPLFFQGSHKETHTKQTMLSILVMFVMLFGGVSLLIAHPMRGTAVEIGTDLMINSQFGSKTYDFYKTSLELQALRSKPDCVNLHSVEECPGFVPTPFTNLWKEMELKYRCAGWGAEALGANVTQAPLDPRRLTANGLNQKLHLGQAASPTNVSPTVPGTAPKTLFSTQELGSSCNGMVGRSMKTFLEDTSDELFAEGTYLLLICITIGFLTFVESCTAPRSTIRKRAMEYGALEYERPYGNKPAQVGRVFQGILRR
jgi:hypothetical protein